MTEEEKKELEELRRFKAQHEGKALHRAFSRLDQLVEVSQLDPAINIRAFRVLAECLICLRDEIGV